MIVKAFEFRGVLEKAPGGSGVANYMFLGDLNTMGMGYKYAPQRSIVAADEIKRFEGFAERKQMRFLTKDEPNTWSNKSTSSLKPSNLDHVAAADHLEFKSINGSEVTVLGWPKLDTDAKKDKWIEDYSDHAMLYFEVQKVV
jgi:hypothetical protein